MGLVLNRPEPAERVRLLNEGEMAFFDYFSVRGQARRPIPASHASFNYVAKPFAVASHGLGSPSFTGLDTFQKSFLVLTLDWTRWPIGHHVKAECTQVVHEIGGAGGIDRARDTPSELSEACRAAAHRLLADAPGSVPPA